MVLHLIASGFFGGPETQILNHLTRATKTGFSIGVCVFSGNGMSTDLGCRARERGIPAFFLETGSKFDLKSLKELRDIVARNGVDVICSHGFKSDFYSYVLKKVHPLKNVSFVRGDTSENLKVYLYTLLDKRLIRTFCHIVTLSEAQKRKVLRLGIPESRVTIVSNAIDVVALSDAASVGKGDLTMVDELVETTPYVVTVGRLSPEKGHRFIVEAMGKIAERRPDLRLVIIGEGQERGRLEAQIRRLGIADRVIMPGFSRTAPYYIRKAAALVNPSLSEGMPNVVLEARALKVPVVATNVGGVEEIIPEGQGGLLVPPSDPGALAAAILRLLRDETRRRDLVENGYEAFRRRFDVAAQTDRLVEFYRWMRRN